MKIKFFVFVIAFAAQCFAQQTIKSYSNYDFVPGDKIIFEDDFTSTMDGEFPATWDLRAGQGVVNKMDDKSVFVLTDGNYAVVAPRIKTEKYLDTVFTVECDFYGEENGLVIVMGSEGNYEITGVLVEAAGDVSTHYMPEGVDLHAIHPETESFVPGTWHHIAIAYKNDQMKVYVDQYRVLVIPHTKYTPEFVRFAGVAPLRFTNVRIALGGGMNMLDELYRNGRIVSHGILFDVNKATLKPQSMGPINNVVKMLKQDTKIKLIIEGHTDSDGDDAKNMTLSEQRADAVKKALVELGIDAERLETKGYGETKPIDNNNTNEGKANNRRVEFVLVKQ